jgi:hypothetical protein
VDSILQRPSDRVIKQLDSEDELFEELEQETENWSGFREKRIQQLRQE